MPLSEYIWESLVSDVSECDTTWEEWARIAEFAGTIDFGCQFVDGKCAALRTKAKEWYTTPQCCCRDCGVSIGHLDSLPEEAIAEVSALYDDETGFWRPDGCVMPRKWRSGTCLGFRCKAAKRNNPDSKDFNILCDYLNCGDVS